MVLTIELVNEILQCYHSIKPQYFYSQYNVYFNIIFQNEIWSFRSSLNLACFRTERDTRINAVF